MLIRRDVADVSEALKNAPLRAVLQHWHNARGPRFLPSWSDIDPGVLRHYLPMIWSWRYDRGSDSFTGRLAGEMIVHLLGRSPRQVAMSDFFQPAHYPMIFERFKRAVSGPAILVISGPVYGYAGRCGHGERLLLPLAQDGETVDEVMGATCYEIASAADLPPFDAEAESVTAFALQADPGPASPPGGLLS